MSDVVGFELPAQWDEVVGFLKSGFSRVELIDFAKKFKKFDINGDGVIDLMELKRCQELLDAQTHLKMKDYLASMQKSGHGAEITFKDWITLQGLIFKRDLVWAKGRGGYIPPIETTKAKKADDESHVGKKSFFEKLAAEQTAQIKRDEALRSNDAAAKAKAAAEKEARRVAAEEEKAERARRRKAFLAKNRGNFEATS